MSLAGPLAGAQGAGAPASSTASPGAISRRSSASRSTGRAPAASRWSRPARARATSRTTTSPRPTRCGRSSTSYLKIDDRRSINPKMFNSFIDGTKSGIEMSAVCNATGLVPQSDGLGFPPASRFELAEVCKPKSAGGTLEKAGVTEVVSSVYRDGRDVPHHLALGTYVVFEGESDYARRCFREYAMLPDTSGRYAALYRPIHMIGLELGVSVASRRAAQRADRRADRLSLRRGRDRQAPAEEGRGARRRGRLLRLGQADAGRPFARRWIAAARPRLRTSSSSATSRRARRSDGRTSSTIRTTSRSRCGAKWKRPSAAGMPRQRIDASFEMIAWRSD